MDEKDLPKYRDEIAKIDDRIAYLLIKRFELTDEIGRFKKRNNISVENKEVEEKILARLMDKTDDQPNKESIFKIYTEIFSQSKERQRKILL